MQTSLSSWFGNEAVRTRLRSLQHATFCPTRTGKASPPARPPPFLRTAMSKRNGCAPAQAPWENSTSSLALCPGLWPRQFFLKQHYPKHLTTNCPNTTVCGAAIRRNPTGLHEEPAQTLQSNAQNTQREPSPAPCTLFLPSPLRLADALKSLTFKKIFKIFFQDLV